MTCSHGKQEIEFVKSRWPNASILRAWCFYFKCRKYGAPGSFSNHQHFAVSTSICGVACLLPAFGGSIGDDVKAGLWTGPWTGIWTQF